MTVVHIVQHAEKNRESADPGLTERGHAQAALVAEWAGRQGLAALYSSPLRRAQETAAAIARATGLPIVVDDRVRERMNWDGAQSLSEFLDEWAHATEDRSFTPSVGDSSQAAGARFRDFLVAHAGDTGPIAVVAHGGVTVDLLRTLLGDEGVSDTLIANGVPSCAVTTIDGLDVKAVASDVTPSSAGSGWRAV